MDRRWGTLLLLLVAATAVAGASSEPSPICYLCGEGFERDAADAGVPANATGVTGSELHVYLRADGDAGRVVRNRVNESTARYFRQHPEKLQETVRGEVRRAEGPIDARMDATNRTVVVTYRVADVATRSVDVLVYDRYLTTGRPPGWRVNTDRFVVHAPDDHRLASDPGGDRRPSAVAWRGGFDHRTFVAFASDGTTAPELRATLALAVDVAPTVLRQFAMVVIPGVVLFGVGLSAATTGRRGVQSIAPEYLGAVVAAVVGGLFAVVFLGPVEVDARLFAGPLVALGLAAFAHPRLRPGTTVTAVGRVAAPVAVAVAVVLVVAPPGAERAIAVGVCVQFGACLLLGVLQAREAPAIRRAAVVALIGTPYVLWAVRELPIYGYGVSRAVVLGAVLAVAGASIGTVLYCLGTALGARADETADVSGVDR